MIEDNKLETIQNLFEGKEIRSIWDSEKEEYFFSVIDVVSALTDSNDPAHYWRTLKSRMIQEGNETVTSCDTFKLKAKDGKMRNTDMLDTQNILRLIESIPSPKAEPFKMWLASLGNERINEVFDPEIAVNRAVEYYRNKGYSDDWIKARLNDIAREEHPKGLKENLKVAKRGGGVAKGARDIYEKETKKSAISKSNSLKYQYVNNLKQIEQSTEN